MNIRIKDISIIIIYLFKIRNICPVVILILKYQKLKSIKIKKYLLCQ